MSAQQPMPGRISIVPNLGRMSAFTTGSRSVASMGVNAKPMPNIPKPTVSITDSRQLDKVAMASKIFRYFESQPEVPFTLTEKKIQGDVITKDFINMFSFIYRRIDPDFVMGKVDEHVSGFGMVSFHSFNCRCITGSSDLHFPRLPVPNPEEVFHSPRC